MIRLDVPFREKDDAKALGARWNYREKYWYCEDDQVDRFLRWYIPPDDRGSSDTEVGGDTGTDTTPTEGTAPDYLTVSEIGALIEDCFYRTERFRMIRVRGEILNYDGPWNGFHFFDIKDDRSMLSCVIRPETAQVALDFTIENGQEVGILGNLEFFTRRGESQLAVARIRDLGEGDYQTRLKLLRDKLQAEGLFDEEHKKPLPKYPERVGILTSRQADALRDICRVAHDRNPYVQLVLYPVTVQGDSAPASILQGLAYMDAAGMDVIIVSRGGGSREDLKPFDDEAVVRAVYHARTPIVTGVGHERDITLIDLVADRRFSTPTYAAQGVLPDVMSDIRRIRQYEAAMRTGMSNRIGQKRLLLQTRTERLERYNPRLVLQRNRERLIHAEQNLITQIRRVMDEKKHRYEVLVATLHGCSPTAKLMNGFGYVTQDDRPVTTVDEVQPDQRIQVRIHDGRITAVVEEVTHGKED